MRRGERLSLRWANVDFERGLIHMMNSQREQTKSGHSRSIPMNRLARRELLGLHRETGHTEYVFFNDKTKKPRTDLKNGFGTACVIAGLDAFAFTICDTQRQPGSPTPAPILERSWPFSAIAVFKHLRVTLTPPTRGCGAQ
jgi:integrase